MLVLTRKTSESIVIGNEIVVTVLEVRGDQVRLGIDAPRAIAVHREEVYQQVVAENAAAVSSRLGARQRDLLRRRIPEGGMPTQPIPRTSPTPTPDAAPRRHPGAPPA